MSATPTRVEGDTAPAAVADAALHAGNRALESIARHEALSSLLAFSGLREQLRTRRGSAEPIPNDLLQTERFVLDEVLQLICDRALAATGAHGLLIALAEGSVIFCRASSGTASVERGTRIPTDSEFLAECLVSGEIVRCDDAETDARVEFDLVRKIGATSSVLVPLRGTNARLGVLQAFSRIPLGFTDQDVRSLDLFAELVLAALKPEDQDRRINWLSDIASEVLTTKAEARVEPSHCGELKVESQVEAPIVGVDLVQSPANSQNVERAGIQAVAVSTSVAAEGTGNIESAGSDKADAEEITGPQPAPKGVDDADDVAASLWGHPETLAAIEASLAPAFDNAGLRQKADLPTAVARLDVLSDTTADSSAKFGSSGKDTSSGLLFQPLAMQEQTASAGAESILSQPETPLDVPQFKLLQFKERLQPQAEPEPRYQRLPDLVAFSSSRPVLTIIAALVVVAALFSAGVWWGMQMHGPAQKVTSAARLRMPQPAGSETATDNLMDPARFAPQEQSSARPEDGKPLPKITAVRHWSSAVGSTVVLDMDDQVPYEVHRLMSPERIYFDLHDTVLAPSLDGQTIDVGDTALARVRIAQPVPGVTRLVLDTRDGSNFSVSMESNPYRLVIELRGNDRAASVARAPQSGRKSEAATAALSPAPPKPTEEKLAARTGKFRIVLDAGHGGWDLGTVGRQGLVEKDLVLDVTQRLGKLLQSRLGAEVVLTRSTDDYLPLEQRADVANQAQADLFVSVHANYSNSANARGVETYYSNFFAAPGSKEVEMRENEGVKPAPVSLSATALQEKIEQSRRLAISVQRSLYAALAPKSPDIRDRGTKDAAFVVLTGTTMPAILTEISFVSSPADEHNLQAEGYRQQIAEALYKGIARYEDSVPHVKVAQLRSTSARR